MKSRTRREFGRLTGGLALAALGPQLAASETKARVVVVGGGIGGATAAKYLAASARTIEVTLVEPKPNYTTCFFSNLYLAGLCSLESLTHGYETLAQRYGINVIHDSVTAVDPVAKTLELKSGPKLPYDRVVVAPGIAFNYDALAGYDEAATQAIPNAWNAGPQTQLLRRQLESMEDGGVFLLVAPPDPFRCPPAPYERASLVAYYFKQYKPHSRILILDAKDSFNAQDLFLDAWERHYRGMIEWLPAQFTGGVKAIDVKERSVRTASDTFKAAVVNVIPPQMAGQFAQQIGLVDQSGWCPVDPTTFESKLQPGTHVVGDATNAGDMPKSAFVANSQAKACAFAIAATLTGSERVPPHLFNTCYTFLSPDDAVSNAVSFKPAAGTIKIVDNFVSQVQESAETRHRTAREAHSWYAAFTRDTFG